MTKLVFERRHDGLITGFIASGHAGYAERGSDIVCASISALTQATAGGLGEIVKIPTRVQVRPEDGYLSVLTDSADETLLERAQILFRTLEEALKAISIDYPGTIRIIYRERR